MDLYLEKPEAAPEPVVVDKEKLTTDILNLLVTGCPEDYKLPCVKTGEDLPKVHVTSIAQAKQGVACSAIASSIYDNIVAESKALKAMRPTEYSTQTAFLAALNERATVLSGDLALTKLKAYENVTTWTALKALYPSVEAVAVEK